jgi:predicted DsbA family dithiol-disulfide isomerase
MPSPTSATATAAATTTKLRIDIISDVVCPWCVIGYRQLGRALEQNGIAADIHWHPFELNPHIGAEGENLREHLAKKYGMSLEASVIARDRLTAMGRELGFTFNYADEMHTYNTFRAHQLVKWASMQGRQHDMNMALFGAYFTHRRDVGDVVVLADVAAEIGLDRDDALAVLADERYAAEVRREQQFWKSQGIDGVPAIVFAQQHLVTGAQGIATFASILSQITVSTTGEEHEH